MGRASNRDLRIQQQELMTAAQFSMVGIPTLGYVRDASRLSAVFKTTDGGSGKSDPQSPTTTGSITPTQKYDF